MVDPTPDERKLLTLELEILHLPRCLATLLGELTVLGALSLVVACVQETALSLKGKVELVDVGCRKDL